MRFEYLVIPEYGLLYNPRSYGGTHILSLGVLEFFHLNSLAQGPCLKIYHFFFSKELIKTRIFLE